MPPSPNSLTFLKIRSCTTVTNIPKGRPNSASRLSQITSTSRSESDQLYIYIIATCHSSEHRLLKKAENDSCTTGKSTIGDEKNWNVFMRLDTPQAKCVVCQAEEMVIELSCIMLTGLPVTDKPLGRLKL